MMLDTPQDAGRRGDAGERSRDVSDTETNLDAWYTEVYGGDVQFAEDFGMVDPGDSEAEMVDLDSDVGEIFDTILVQQAATDDAASGVRTPGILSDDRVPTLPMLFPVRWHSLSQQNKAKFRTMMEWFHSAISEDEPVVIDVRTDPPEAEPDGTVVVELSVRPLTEGEAGSAVGDDTAWVG
jgi:hypothetical protein